MTSAASKKYAIDQLLFKPEPPVEPRQAKRLFCGRTAALQRGLQGLRAGLDTDGRRSRRYDKYPWVVHGESRSGKSHLARCIFAALPDTDERLQIRIAAGGRLDAIAVMRDLFEQFRGRFLNRLLDPRLPVEVSRSGDVMVVRALVEKISLFEPAAQSATLSMEKLSQQSEEYSLELGGSPWLAKFVSKFRKDNSNKSGLQLTLRQPTPSDLAEICGIMAETLLRHSLVRHVLVLMDDVDLLESYISPVQNAKMQRSLLGQAIHILHSAPGVDVVLTARSWFVHSDDKQLHTLVDLSQEPVLRPEELLHIYKRRLAEYARKQPFAAFLTQSALLELALDVSGLPGVYLQHLQTAFYQFLNEDDLTQRDYQWLLTSVRGHLNALREKCSTGYEALENAITKGALTVDVRTHNPFYGTMLQNEYAYQSYYSETTYFISGIVRKVISSRTN